MYKKIITLALSYLIVNISIAQTNRTLSDFQNNPIFSNATIGIYIQDIEGKEVVTLNENLSLTPASTLKIITTATALEVFGESFRYQTTLSFDKKDNNKLIIQGSGDPTLGSSHLYKTPESFVTEWVNQIKKQGKTHITEIMVADDFFGYTGTSSKWLREDLGNYYAAGAYGISVFDNTYEIFFNTMRTDTCPKILKTNPYISKLKFINTLTLNNENKDNGYIWGEPFSYTRLLTGNIPAKKTSFSIKGDIPDPGIFLGETIGQALSKEGVSVNRIKTERETYIANKYSSNKQTNTENNIFFTHNSPTLKDIIRIINTKSNNHYSEHLLRTIGRYKNKNIYSDPLEEGIEFIKNYWQTKGIDTNALFMYDGCGLAPSNAVSPKLLCNILRYMYSESKNKEAFLASFPKAGQEGTVRNFMKGNLSTTEILVKSGSIANVQCYTGYYIVGEKKYVFAIMVNNFQSDSRRKTVSAIEKFITDILN